MNVVICHSQVPFVRGGAEELVDGLLAAIRRAGHRAEVVALPLKWYPREQLLNTAVAWRLLDLTESNGIKIDRVICTKFPTWAVRHPHKVAWLVHQHRQAYDLLGTGLSDFNGSPVDESVRYRLREIDRRGLGECKQFFTISANVANRLRRTTGLAAQPLHVPTNRTGLEPLDYGDFILSLARLDKTKRIDRLLDALALLPGARAVIAGEGQERQRLQAQAARLGLKARVEFPGRVSDEEAVALFNRARAVFYGPFDEDFGIATVEAMRAGKPVVTFRDSGGVLELVEHEKTGLVVCPDPGTLAAALGRLLGDRALAQRLGSAGRRRVADLTWEHVVATLLEGGR